MATYQGHHSLIGTPIPMPNLSPNRCILENSIGPRAELSILASLNGCQTVLQDQQALVHLCLSLFRRRNWKRHIFGPDLRGGMTVVGRMICTGRNSGVGRACSGMLYQGSFGVWA